MIRFRKRPLLLGVLLAGVTGLLGVTTWHLLTGSRGRDRDGASPPPAGVVPSAPTGSAGETTPPRMERVVDVATGGIRTCAVLDDGTVRCWGNNDHGELGIGEQMSAAPAAPVTLRGLARVRRVVLDAWHGCAVDDAGALSCWGWGSDGELGFESPDCCINGPHCEPCATSPHLVPGLGAAVVDFALGNMHTCAVLADGGVACWGDGDQGKLGFVPKEQGPHGASTFTPRRVPGLAGVKQVALGFDHTCALHQDGGVSCWGSNRFGQLGRGTDDTLPHVAPMRVPGLSGVAQLASGTSHICARLDDGTVRCWGSNDHGELGVPSEKRGRGDVGRTRSPVPIAGFHGVRDLVAAYGVTCALLEDGLARCWGIDRDDSLHVGAPDDCSEPGFPHPCAKTPMLVRDVPPLARLSTAAGHTCGVARSGELWCWGEIDGFGFDPRSCEATDGSCSKPPRRISW